MNSNFKLIKTFTILIIFIYSTNVAQTNVEKIINVYKKFEHTVKEKDGAGHLDLYLSEKTPVNVFIQKDDRPDHRYSKNAGIWSNQISRMKKPYRLDIGEFKVVEIGNGLAISIAPFKEFYDNKASSIGIDVFTYVNTNNGWKLAALNNTVKKPEEDKKKFQYSTLNKPIDVVNKFKESIENGNKGDFIENFYKTLSPIIEIENGNVSNTFDAFTQTAASVSDNIFKTNISDVKYIYKNLETKVYDGIITVITNDFDLQIKGNSIRKGKHLWIIILDEDLKWKVSGLFAVIK